MDLEKRIKNLEEELYSKNKKINDLEIRFSRLTQIIEEKLQINLLELRLTKEGERFIDDFLADKDV